MSYTDIDNPLEHFNTVTYTGNVDHSSANGSQNITGVGFEPDWVWIKPKTLGYAAGSHNLTDSVRGEGVGLFMDSNSGEYDYGTSANGGSVTAFGSDGFTLGGASQVNEDSNTYVAWNWLAGGTAPTKTYTVKVVSDSGNKYRFDDFGTSAVTLDLQEGGTYTFDQSDSSNSGHPLRFSTTSDGTHGGGSEYTTGVTTTGTPGSAGAKTVITLGTGVATLYYYCTQHSGMGGQANTNSTHGSSNFSGSIQSTASVNTTAGFSIVTWTGNGTAGQTIGHGLGAVPNIIITKGRSSALNWFLFDSMSSYLKRLKLNTNDTQANTDGLNDTAPTSSVFTVSGGGEANTSGVTYIGYLFAEKKGYSKFGSYTGNGSSSDGTFIYLGFKPAWFLVKRTDGSDHWTLWDNKRETTMNPNDNVLYPSTTGAESSSDTSYACDFLSNGIKWRGASTGMNTSGGTYIYIAFAESPFVNSNGVPNNAR
tara:strand:- start:6 stop:1439 length:1434 start_codon:yes stop_codon:yes gene_type:complete